MRITPGGRARIIAWVSSLGCALGITQGLGCVGQAPAEGCTSRLDCTREELCLRKVCVSAPLGFDSKPDAGSSRGGPASPPQMTSSDGPDAGTAPEMGADGGTINNPLPLEPGCPVVAVIVPSGKYCSIGAAIAASAPGDTIIVATGLHAEAIQVTKAITLEGSASGGTSIIGLGGVPTIRLGGDGVVVRNLSVNGSGQIGIELAGTARLENVRVEGSFGAGVLVQPEANATLVGVTVSGVAPDSLGNADGIAAGPGATLSVSASEIRDAAQVGVSAFGARVTIQGTRVLRNGRATCTRTNPNACAPGVFGTENSTLIIEQNTEIVDNGWGVYVERSALTMSGSTSRLNGLADTLGDGVYVSQTTDVSVQTSVLSDNAGYGIYCEPGTSVKACTGNTHTGNGLAYTSCPGC